jgi:hypothetical protein
VSGEETESTEEHPGHPKPAYVGVAKLKSFRDVMDSVSWVGQRPKAPRAKGQTRNQGSIT